MSLHLDMTMTFSDDTTEEVSCVTGTIRDIFESFVTDVTGLTEEEFAGTEIVIANPEVIRSFAVHAARCFDVDIVTDTYVDGRPIIAIDTPEDKDEDFHVAEMACAPFRSRSLHTPEREADLLGILGEIMTGGRLYGHPVAEVKRIAFELV